MMTGVYADLHSAKNINNKNNKTCLLHLYNTRIVQRDIFEDHDATRAQCEHTDDTLPSCSFHDTKCTVRAIKAHQQLSFLNVRYIFMPIVA